MAHMKRDVVLKAITHLDENHDFFCSRSMLHFKVWMISGMAMCTASYDIFCIFLLVKLIGRNSFQDDPYFLMTEVQPGKMPIGNLGILLSITFFGAMISQVTLIPLADRFGRKMIFEISLLIMLIASVLSATSFFSLIKNANSANVVGSLAFWRFLLGLGCGGIYPLTATLMAEYSSKFSRGTYLSLVFLAQGSGIVAACLVTLIASTAVGYLYHSSNFPTEVAGCSSFAFQDGNGLIPCPSALQKAYYDLVKNSSPQENEYIWRSVAATGAFGAVLTLTLSCIFLYETPRFTSHILGNHQKAIEDLANQCEVDYTRDIRSIASFESDMPEERADVNNLNMSQFFAKHSVGLFLASTTWFIFNLVFSGLLILIDQPTMIIGFTKGNMWQPASEEVYGLALGYLTVCLVALIPGYFFAVMSVDIVGRKLLQFLGFVIMAVWCAACSGSYTYLTNPNDTDGSYSMNANGTRSHWMSGAAGWMVMFGLVFFFASWGPLTTTYIIPCELFPTQWRVTGYSICAASGSLGSIIGVWIFTYASQPYPKEVTYAYPCTRSGYPSDFDPMSNGACLAMNYCPPGRSAGGAIMSNCDTCQSMTNSGCYPFGLGLKGSMAIMVPILAFGAVFTMIIPLTDRRSLEELTQEELFVDVDNTDDPLSENPNFKNFDNFEMVESNIGYEGDIVLDKFNKNPLQHGSLDVFAEKAAAARRAATLARAEEESRVLEAVIAADDSAAREDKLSRMRGAAAAARFEVDARAARSYSSASSSKKSSIR